MLLNDLSLSEAANTDQIKAALEQRLQSVLPQGSFNIILRTYQGDVRARNTNKVNFTTMILLDPAGRKAALDHKTEIEALGFSVSGKGDIRAN